ncbi:MAG: nuclear transport factor 2 family protein [Rhodocyclaceae bacterium]|nr:nuclear transport factor 2 family protein [Rhodocyclaceae bacterium]
MSLTNLNPAAQTTLDQWHQMLLAGDLSGLPALLHPDAVFRSPMAHTPYPGAMMVNLILNTVSKVFSDFTYHREFATDDGLSAILEFSARVGDKALKGIDMIRFNEQGQIVDFEVMIRPMSGLQALGAEMAQRLAPYLAKAAPAH